MKSHRPPLVAFAPVGLFVAGVALLVTGHPANAAIVTTKDSTGFTYKYEMDTNPSSQDLDSNSTSDWFSGAANGLIIPQTYSGGFASSNESANQVLFRTDFTNSITRNQLSANTPYTLEFNVQKTGGTQGTNGWFAAMLQSPGTSDSIRVSLEDNAVTVRTTGGTFTPYLTGTNFASGDHTVRIAYEGSNNYYVWVDGTLLNADLSTPLHGGNGDVNNLGVWFIGDFSADTSGDWKVDDIRFDPGTASAPLLATVPTPAALPAGLVLLGLAATRRRRGV